MSEVTLGQVAAALAFMAALITSVGILSNKLKTWLTDALKDQFKPINTKIDAFEKKLDSVDMESCKNYLVSFLANVEKNNPINEIEKERFWEEYQHYTKIGGNSYIRRKVEQLESEHKL